MNQYEWFHSREVLVAPKVLLSSEKCILKINWKPIEKLIVISLFQPFWIYSFSEKKKQINSSYFPILLVAQSLIVLKYVLI